MKNKDNNCELDALIEACLDGRLSEAEADRLSQGIEEFSEARRSGVGQASSSCPRGAWHTAHSIITPRVSIRGARRVKKLKRRPREVGSRSLKPYWLPDTPAIARFCPRNSSNRGHTGIP